MRRVVRTGIVAGLILSILPVVSPVPAGAHNYTGYYHDDGYGIRRWDTFTPEWHASQVFAGQGSAFIARAKSAFAVWNNQSSSFRFFYNSYVIAGGSEDCRANTSTYALILFAPLADGLASTLNCARWSGDRFYINRSTVTINSNPRFNDGSPARWHARAGEGNFGDIDLQKVISHEAGHVAGQLHHWDDPGKDASLCHPNVPSSVSHTMCNSPGIPGWDTNERSPESHDLGTLVNAYANHTPPPPPTTTTVRPTTTTTYRPPSGGGGGKPSCQVNGGGEPEISPALAQLIDSTDGSPEVSPDAGPDTTDADHNAFTLLPDFVRGCV